MAHLDRLDAHAADATPAGLSDAEVVRRVPAGERELFEVLMRRYDQRVFRAIRSVLEEGMRSTQEAFVFLGWRCDRMVANVMGRMLAGPPHV
jgi:hypothetical protein